MKHGVDGCMESREGGRRQEEGEGKRKRFVSFFLDCCQFSFLFVVSFHSWLLLPVFVVGCCQFSFLVVASFRSWLLPVFVLGYCQFLFLVVARFCSWLLPVFVENWFKAVVVSNR